MNKSNPLFNVIKTPCGREKLTLLASKQGLLAKLRLLWFVIFATLKDINIPNPDHDEDSDF